MNITNYFGPFAFLKVYSYVHLRDVPQRSGSALKTGRREVPGSISDRACPSNSLEFSVIFSETRANTG